jgi:F-type H+-transporting ATPase subunit b
VRTSKYLVRFSRFAALALALVLFAPAASQMHAQAAPSGRPHAAAGEGEKATPEGAVPEKREQVRDENDEYRHSPMVVKMGSMLGMNPEQAATAFTVFNFLVLLVAVGYAALKILPKAFQKRSATIQRQLVDARTATEEATARLSSVEARLSRLDAQIGTMRKQSETDSARDERRIRDSVEEEKKKILAAADAEIGAATAAARREIQEYAASLAIEQAARKLVITAETDRLLVESFAHRLGGDKGESN